MPTYRLQANPTMAEFDQLFGWRRVTNWLFGWPKRGRPVVLMGDLIITNPKNVEVVGSWLTARGHRWVHAVPVLQAVPTEKQQ